MRVNIRDQDALQAISPAALSGYARTSGWCKLESFGEHSDVYAAEELPEVIVPRTRRLGDYASIVSQLIEIFARVAMSAANRVLAESPRASLTSIAPGVRSFPIVSPRSSPRPRASREAGCSSRATQKHQYQQPSIGYEFGCIWIEFARMNRNSGRQRGPSSRLVLHGNAANE